MRGIFATVVLGTVLASRALTLQAEPAASAPITGVINMQEIILTVEEGKAARATLEKEIKAKEEVWQKQQKDFDKLNEEFQKQAAVLSDDAKMKKHRELQEKFLKLNGEKQDFQNDIKKREMEATQKIALKAAKITEKLAKEKDLQIVFEANQSGLVYIKNPSDLTKEVIAQYPNFKEEAGASSKPAAAPSVAAPAAPPR